MLAASLQQDYNRLRFERQTHPPLSQPPTARSLGGQAALLATAAADSDAAATEAAIEAQVLAASLASLPAARQAPGGGSEADSTCSALVAMGFAAAAAREAAARFGADLDSAVEYLAG